jgi:hypothetical protein
VSFEQEYKKWKLHYVRKKRISKHTDIYVFLRELYLGPKITVFVPDIVHINDDDDHDDPCELYYTLKYMMMMLSGDDDVGDDDDDGGDDDHDDII